ncbi:exosome non-catalytic core subunit rrp46 [Malassezia yamatoensis]|uniref:Exosome non-catalytic core subunit rrp46 n=1 Tax=Malassezia yamatoensis TaxID=253288 RepID=A0AAJ6CI41_9BASI|nr:exosome non-catalytic core subunit rrp46 [Malassezia yamatoensis]
MEAAGSLTVGNAFLSTGSQISIASVTGPVEVRMRDELTDTATFQVVMSPLNNVAGIPTKAFGAELQTVFGAVLLLHRHPRTLIQLVVQTTSKPMTTTPTVNLSLNTGEVNISAEQSNKALRTARLRGPDIPFLASEMATSINASMLALIDAGIPLRATITATSCAVLSVDDALCTRDIDPSQKSIWYVCNPNFSIVVDPSPEEEQRAISCHVYAFAFSGYDPLHSQHQDHQAQVELLYCASTGITNAKQRNDLYSIAREAANEQFHHLRSVLESNAS